MLGTGGQTWNLACYLNLSERKPRHAFGVMVATSSCIVDHAMKYVEP